MSLTRTSLRLVVAGTLAAAPLVLPAVSASAQTCDAYSGGCATPAPTATPGAGDGQENGEGDGSGNGGGTPTSGAGGDGAPGAGDGGAPGAGDGDAPGGGDSGAPGTGTSTDEAGTQDAGGALPFTGGETVLMATVGLGAVVGGTALVVAGRRRRESAA